ncbi:DUF4157 domain-containing protein [Lentzea sp. NPDC005914]|uniref:eCIS core domain-containing protein n=1 Tax=Lentzea sp. NPDC005914 TaxID=3154572 RepID=UPI0033FA2834
MARRAKPRSLSGERRLSAADDSTATIRPTPHLSNRAIASLLSAGKPLPVSITGMEQVGNKAVARMLGGHEVRRVNSSDVAGATLTPHVAAHIDARRGGGSALPDDVRLPMQQHLGTDLDGVRVHTDDIAAALTRSLAAKAFTSGHDIFFSPGSYAPQSSSGRQLIAHEAVHVAQQHVGRSGLSGRISDPSDASESEARALAPTVARSVDTAVSLVDLSVDPPVTVPAGAVTQRAPGPDALAPDLGTLLSVPALEALRREATQVSLLAGAYTERGIQTVDTLKTAVVGASDRYTQAYEAYAKVIRAAGEEARNQQDWINIFVGIGIGVSVGLLSAAVVPEGLALGWATLAEVAGETVEAVAAAGVQASGITTVAGTDLQPGGLDPHVLSTGVWRNLADLYRGVLGVQRHTQYLPLILGGTEYALGQFRLAEVGASADMKQSELVDMAVSLNRAGVHLRLLGPELTRRLSALDRLREAAAAIKHRGIREVEQDVWIMWMETVPDGQSDILDLDEIEDHLAAIGMLGSGSILGVDFGLWTSTDDELEALVAARAQAREVHARYNALGR